MSRVEPAVAEEGRTLKAAAGLCRVKPCCILHPLE